MNKILILLTCTLLIFGACKSKEGASKSSNAGERTKNKVLVGLDIQRIEVLRFPPYAKDGSRWDSFALLSANPDIYVSIKQLGKSLWKSNVKEDCEAGVKLDFTDLLPLEIRAFTNEVLIEVFDEDGVTNDDNMGYITFRPSDFKKQNEIRLKTSDGELELLLKVEWKYETR